MSASPHPILPLAPFSGLSLPATEGNGVVIADRDALGIATVLVRKGQGTALAGRLRDSYGIDLPSGPQRTVAGPLALVGTGPGAWLATLEQGGNGFAASLAELTRGLASVSDQSDGLAVLRLSGPKVREALSKLIYLDLHPRAFGVGGVAVTSAAEIGATLWRLEDRADESAAFEVAVYRSYASSFWEALVESAAEFGCVLQGSLDKDKSLS